MQVSTSGEEARLGGLWAYCLEALSSLGSVVAASPTWIQFRSVSASFPLLAASELGRLHLVLPPHDLSSPARTVAGTSSGVAR